MMKKKILSAVLATTLVATTLAGCTGGTPSSTTPASAAEGTASKAASNVTISMLNSKGEIQTALEGLAKKYKDKTGVTVEVTACATGASPFETISKNYSSGNPPTMAILDTTDIVTIAKDKALDLSKEKWVNDGGNMVYKMDNVVYSFPLCVEGRGIIYNKTAIEKTLKKSFDPNFIHSYDELKALFEELRKAGMTNPIVISKEDWSLGAHQLQYLYETQTGKAADTAAFTEKLKKGEVKIADDKRFGQFIQTFDLLREYNYNKKDPLGAVYEKDPIYLAEGNAAFWFNGNWAWPNIKEAGGESNEYGILPYVLGNDKADFANNAIQASPSKQIMIDKIKATPEQQQAAKDFLNWLVYDKDGQDGLVNSLQIIPAFKNITLKPTDPLGIAVKSYVDAGKVFDPAIVPGDHWKVMGASMQKYLAGKMDKTALAADLEKYWKSAK
jgi:raffinose/stachyose/melibiose transport system substrate-binding protein